jgi:hypothetical protein
VGHIDVQGQRSAPVTACVVLVTRVVLGHSREPVRTKYTNPSAASLRRGPGRAAIALARRPTQRRDAAPRADPPRLRRVFYDYYYYILFQGAAKQVEF